MLQLIRWNVETHPISHILWMDVCGSGAFIESLELCLGSEIFITSDMKTIVGVAFDTQKKQLLQFATHMLD